MKDQTIEFILQALKLAYSEGWLARLLKTIYETDESIKALLGDDLAAVESIPAEFDSINDRTTYVTKRRYYNELLLHIQHGECVSFPGVKEGAIERYSLLTQIEDLCSETAAPSLVLLVDMEWLLADQSVSSADKSTQLKELRIAGALIVIVSTAISIETAQADSGWQDWLEEELDSLAKCQWLATMGTMDLVDLAEVIRQKIPVVTAVVATENRDTVFAIAQNKTLVTAEKLQDLSYAEELALDRDKILDLFNIALRLARVTINKKCELLMVLMRNRYTYFLWEIASKYGSVPPFNWESCDKKIGLPTVESKKFKPLPRANSACINWIEAFLKEENITEKLVVCNKIKQNLVSFFSQEMITDSFIYQGFLNKVQEFYNGLFLVMVERYIKNYCAQYNKSVHIDREIMIGQLINTIREIHPTLTENEQAELIIYVFERIAIDSFPDGEMFRELYTRLAAISARSKKILQEHIFRYAEQHIVELLIESWFVKICNEKLSTEPGSGLNELMTKFKRWQPCLPEKSFNVLVTHVVMLIGSYCIRKEAESIDMRLTFRSQQWLFEKFSEHNSELAAELVPCLLEKQLTSLVDKLAEISKGTLIKGLAFFDWDDTQRLTGKKVSELTAEPHSASAPNLLMHEQWAAYFAELKRKGVLPILLTTRSLVCGEVDGIQNILTETGLRDVLVGLLFAGGVVYKAHAIQYIYEMLLTRGVTVQGMTLLDDQEIECVVAGALHTAEPPIPLVAVQAEQRLATLQFHSEARKRIRCLQELDRHIGRIVGEPVASTNTILQFLLAGIDSDSDSDEEIDLEMLAAFVPTDSGSDSDLDSDVESEKTITGHAITL